MPTRGPKEWTPNRIQKILKALESKTVDTSKGQIDPNRIIGAADVLEDNRLIAWHVTDDPEIVIRSLREGIALQELRPWGDICGGLYVSSYPQIWRGRSRKKWEFLHTLPIEKSRQLARALLEKLRLHRESGYLSKGEYERAKHDVEHYWIDMGNWKVLFSIATHPYAINIQELAKQEGIADPFEPSIVEVIFEGRYLNAQGTWQDSAALAAQMAHVPEDMADQGQICQAWKSLGWDGAYTKAAMGSDPELVIWNAARILKFGSWTRGA